jgi:hypothetical protein
MRGIIRTSLVIPILFALHACVDETITTEKKNDTEMFTLSASDTLRTDSTAYYGGYHSQITTLFDQSEFPEAYLEQLLAEIKICNPQIEEMQADGITPCSPNYFQFYSYNKHRKIEDAFMIQVKKGVNGFPYRRLLIFTRENGILVKMNGIIGYLVEKRPAPSGIDDLVVAVVDNIGGYYDRYDVLIRYENGKYQFVEALGDLEGTFDTKELKAEATKQIKKRIEEKELIF